LPGAHISTAAGSVFIPDFSDDDSSIAPIEEAPPTMMPDQLNALPQELEELVLHFAGPATLFPTVSNRARAASVAAGRSQAREFFPGEDVCSAHPTQLLRRLDFRFRGVVDYGRVACVVAFGAVQLSPLYRSSGGIAVDGRGDILAVDVGHHRVCRFTAAGTCVDAGLGQDTLVNPIGIAVGEDDSIFVADRGARRVYRFAPDGGFLYAFEHGGLWLPVDVAVRDDNLFVVDACTHCVWVCKQDGTPVRRFGSHKQYKNADGLISNVPNGTAITGEGLDSPSGIAVRDDGNVFVADSGNARVCVYSNDGQFLRCFGTKGEGYSQLLHPRSITLDAEGNVLVADKRRVSVFKPDGTFIHTVHSSPGDAVRMCGPCGIAFGFDGRVFVADDSCNVFVFCE